MKKLTKAILIVFITGMAGLGITIGAIIGGGILISRDNGKEVEVGEEVQRIAIYTDIAHVNIVESDDKKIELQMNLWADKEIDVADVAMITNENGVMTIYEKAPQNKFFGMFPQPYEVFITVYAPKSMTEEIEWGQAK